MPVPGMRSLQKVSHPCNLYYYSTTAALRFAFFAAEKQPGSGHENSIILQAVPLYSELFVNFRSPASSFDIIRVNIIPCLSP